MNPLTKILVLDGDIGHCLFGKPITQLRLLLSENEICNYEEHRDVHSRRGWQKSRKGIR
jgi:hypothetical protein